MGPMEPLAFLKVFCGLTAGLSFLIVWGAFEVAFAFYPEDKIISKPTGKDPGNDKQ